MLRLADDTWQIRLSVVCDVRAAYSCRGLTFRGWVVKQANLAYRPVIYLLYSYLYTDGE